MSRCAYRLAAALAAVIVASPVFAGNVVVSFDSNGKAGGAGSNTFSFDNLDEAPGNALAINALPLATAPNTNTFNTLYQATVSNFLLNGKGVVGSGLNSGYEVTVVAKFSETGSGSGATGVFTVNGATSRSDANFFEVYLDTAKNANNLAGTGFNDGKLILSGFITAGSSTFTQTSAPGVFSALDQFGANNYPGITSVKGLGGIDITATADFVNTNYFLNLNVGEQVTVDTNGSNNTPFNKVDPSARWVDATNTGTGSGPAPLVGGVGINSGASGAKIPGDNGLTPPNGVPPTTGTKDFQFQDDSSSTFAAATAVPEPSTMALLMAGVGSAGLARLVRRRKQAV
jgi:hypothetical protein